MSNEYTALQRLINKGEFELNLRRSITSNDIFGVWLYWQCKTKPSIINLFGKSFYIYYLFSNDLLWLPLSIFIGFKFGWILGVIAWVIHYLVQKEVLGGIGQGFMLYDAQTNEELFDDLWQNQSVGIVSVKKHESPLYKDGVPDIIIDPTNQDWREAISSIILGYKL